MRIRSHVILWGNFYGFIVLGCILLSFGSLMPDIRETYQLSYEQGGVLLALLAGGNLLASLVSGVLGDQIGMKRILLAGNLFYVIGLVCIASSVTVLFVYVGIFITGLGWGACNTSINLAVNDFIHGDGKIMSLLHMSFGVGAFFMPQIATGLMRLGMSWQGVLLVVAGLAFIAFIIATRMHMPSPEERRAKVAESRQVHQTEAGTDTNISVFKDWRLYVFMAILFFYVGSENAFSGWLVTYLKDTGFSNTFSQTLLSALWIVIIFGRFTNGILSNHFRKDTLIMAAAIGSVLMLIGFIMSHSAITVALFVCLLGFSFSGVYPITVANANPLIKGSGTAGSLITAFGGMGAMVIPYLSGRMAGQFGTTGMILTIIVALVFLNVAALLNKKAHVA